MQITCTKGELINEGRPIYIHISVQISSENDQEMKQNRGEGLGAI